MDEEKKCCCDNEINQTIVEALQEEMRKNGFISEDAIREISKKIKKPVSEIYGVATFYSEFRLIPKAKYTFKVCTGTACFILGAENVISALEQKLGIKLFEISKDKKFQIITVRCLGCCGIAPVMTVNDKIYSKVTRDDAMRIATEIMERAKNEK